MLAPIMAESSDVISKVDGGGIGRDDDCCSMALVISISISVFVLEYYDVFCVIFLFCVVVLVSCR